MGLRAVRQGRVFLADGNAFFNRPGPRLVESAEILAEILHPDVCTFGHRGREYVPYEGEHTPKRDLMTPALCHSYTIWLISSLVPMC